MRVFTGLVADIGKVEAVERSDGGARLRVATPLAAELSEGDSIAVSGACLTATGLTADGFEADAMNQTLELTTLGGLSAGDGVNLELPLRASDRLGGHIVQGHVDGVGEVVAVTEDGIARRLRISVPAGIAPLIAEHGSVAVDGVSLTVARVEGDGFEVALIPETLERTTLGARGEGDRVNVECDVVARYVRRLGVTVQPSESEGK
ncbi:MAG: riboflavin synthase [Solirubrobacterales bacterium]